MTLCSHGLHNDAIVYMLQLVEVLVHIILLAWVVFVKAIFSNPMMEFYLTTYLRFLIKLDIASQTL